MAHATRMVHPARAQSQNAGGASLFSIISLLKRFRRLIAPPTMLVFFWFGRAIGSTDSLFGAASHGGDGGVDGGAEPRGAFTGAEFLVSIVALLGFRASKCLTQFFAEAWPIRLPSPTNLEFPFDATRS